MTALLVAVAGAAANRPAETHTAAAAEAEKAQLKQFEQAAALGTQKRDLMAAVDVGRRTIAIALSAADRSHSHTEKLTLPLVLVHSWSAYAAPAPAADMHCWQQQRCNRWQQLEASKQSAALAALAALGSAQHSLKRAWDHTQLTQLLASTAIEPAVAAFADRRDVATGSSPASS